MLTISTGNFPLISRKKFPRQEHQWSRPHDNSRSLRPLSSNGRAKFLAQAKGYPDLATRRFLRSICDQETWIHSPQPPVFGLFDADPDGVNIMQIYRHGSHSLPHEHELNVPEMQWLGMRADDVLADVQDDESVLRLIARDRRKAVSMLERLRTWSEERFDEQCRLELQKMLMLNMKAEIQIFEDRPGGLDGWLDDKIRKELSRSDNL